MTLAPSPKLAVALQQAGASGLTLSIPAVPVTALVVRARSWGHITQVIWSSESLLVSSASPKGF